MREWDVRTKLAWGAVVAGGLAALLGSALVGPRQDGLAPAAWLTLLALGSAALALALRPVELAADRKVNAASAPVLATALLFDPVVAVVVTAIALLIAQRASHRPSYVLIFNLAQRAASVAAASAVGGIVDPSRTLSSGTAALAGALTFFAVNTASVATMSAARRGANWAATWLAIVRTEGAMEAGLLAAGALCATLLHGAPAAIPLVLPLVWLAWRALADSAQVRTLNQRLTESMDAQRRFVADAAHELRTPTASLRAQVDLLRRDVRQTGSPTGPAQAVEAELPEILDHLAQEAAHLSTLVADLLTLARSDEGAPLAHVDVDLERLLIDVYAEARPIAGGVGLQLDLDESQDVSPRVLGDPDRLRQLVLNLVVNGLHFTPPGGQVVLRCRRLGDVVAVSVADNGIGIAPDALPHVFDRFYRVESSRARAGTSPRGAGLGLSIARSVAEAHGGSISVTSEVGQGSTFTVRLPLAVSSPAAGRSTR